jgi:hypothetical protein
VIKNIIIIFFSLSKNLPDTEKKLIQTQGFDNLFHSSQLKRLWNWFEQEPRRVPSRLPGQNKTGLY